MTKITNDFTGSETIAVTKQRLTDILAYWGASTAAYTTWGQARTALNALLTSTTAGTIGSTELAGTFLPKINFLNDPDEMIADALFGAGEQGVWLDPSDVANVAWRRNLLLWSEAFDLVSEWPRADVSVTANVATAPDGTMTADLLVESATNANHLLNKSGVLTGATGTYTLSCYAKASTRNWFRLQSQSSIGAWVNLNLSTGAVGLSGTGITNVSVVSAGNGWYRISGAVTVSNQPVSAQLFVIDSDRGGGSPSYLGDGTSGIFIWGAQLELGSVATEYQRITDLNTEVIERFPNATMYQDAAGTVPVYAPGQPVGLRLDKSGRGNHAVQSTAGSRPMYGIEPKGGRRNILTWSEDYSNAAWVKQDATIAANAIAAPDGSLTADLVTGTGATPRFYQLAAPLVNGATYTITAYAKQGTSPSVRFDFINISDGPTFTFATKSWGSLPAAFTSVGVEELANGWFRLRATALCSNNSGGPGFATSGSNTVYLWGAQLELGTTATAYQRVTTAFDVTEAGVNTCHYCQYDGSDDGMVTNSIDFTATDKMSVFAGVRKSSDALQGAIIESSTGLQNGSFGFWTGGPITAGANYHFNSRGNATGTAITPTSYAAPITNVLTGLGDISGDTATIRINGTQVAQSTADQGVGTFGNYPIYLGRRAGSTYPFNGRDYGIIVTGKLANATAIATTEMWLANKTAGVTL